MTADAGHMSMTFVDGVAACQNPDAWHRDLPKIDPQTAGMILCRDLPGGMEVMIRNDFARQDQLCLTLSGSGLFSTRNIAVREGFLTSGSVDVAASQQHRGTGRIAVRNQIEFAVAAGLQRMFIHAGDKNGAYTWARFGFLPAYPDGDEFRTDMNTEIAKRYLAIEPLLSRDERIKVEDCLPLETGMDMWRLSDLRINMTRRLSEVFMEATLSQGDGSLSQLDRLAMKFCSTNPDGKPTQLAAVLMSGSCWDGFLDFGNDEQMSRAGKYVGGWMTRVNTGEKPCP